MNSMTGYGFREAVVDGAQVSVEMKSVNNRFLDLSVSLPPFLGPAEAKIRRLVGERVARGKVDVTVRVRGLESPAVVSADTRAAVMYAEAIGEIARALGREGEVPLPLILSQDGVLNVTREYDAEACWAKVEPVFEEVLGQFVEDRRREGENLRRDLLEKLDVLDGCAAFFLEWQPRMEARFREQVRSRFEELLGDRVDENRVMSEVAAMLVRYTINEEIVRLRSHLAALRDEISRNPVPGKRLDFICQEANREINTIGSKNQFAEVGAMVVNAKDALENIREQGKNVE